MGLLSAFRASRATLGNNEIDKYLTPINDEQRKRLQKTVLAMYKDVMDYCEKEQIIPFLIGGSALGAVRHSGFIPWDDDLDIGMLRSHYDKFVYGFEKEYGSKYIVNSPGKDVNAKCRFTKVMKKGTICKEYGGPSDESINGIYIDLFPIDFVPDNALIRTVKGIHCNTIEYVSNQVYEREYGEHNKAHGQNKTTMQQFASVVKEVIGFVFSYRSSAGWFKRLNEVEQWHKHNTKYCSIVPGRKHYFGELINNRIMPPRYVDFECLKAPVFSNVEDYLANLYGHDYMVIPPVEKRERHMIAKLKFGDE